MNTEKEILLNKKKIKALENKIKIDENSISYEGHNFTRIVYEHKLLAKESANFIEATSRSKDDFEKIVLDILNNSKNDSVQILRRNIANIRFIYESTNPNLSEKGEFINRTNLKNIHRFDAPYLTQEEGFKASSAYSVDIKDILDYAEILDYCEFNSEIILTNEKNVLHKTDCLIEEGAIDAAIAIDLDKNFETFKRSIFEKDKNKKKEYLIKYAKGLKDQINQLSKLDLNKTTNNLPLSPYILYIPNESALRNVLAIEPEIIKYALDKYINISFPTAFLAGVYLISTNSAPDGISKEFEKYEKVHNMLIKNKRKEIESNKEKIDKLLKINFEYLKAPSYQIKVTLNHEENYVLEEIVNTKGSNKSSVLRQILMEYNGIYKERDALKLSVEKLNLEKKFLEQKRIDDLEAWAKDQEIKLNNLLSDRDKNFMNMQHNLELKAQEDKRELAILQNELMRRTEQFQLESKTLREEIHRKDELMHKSIKSINESLVNKDQSLKEDERKNTIQVIKPKEINEFGNIMELINQNILILCDTSSISDKDQQKFIDMVYGGVYGLKGKIKEVSTNIFLYIPQNFDFLDI